MAKKLPDSKRGPSDKLAKARAKAKQIKVKASSAHKSTEEKFRKSGGYGRGTVSCWDIPPGGIKNSPAYKFILSRSGGKMLPAKDRSGAPVKGGYPLNKYPPNVLVDCIRSYWLPDDWAQVVKNTGPGGVYVGWMSPEGKFFYHRHGYTSAIEETLGKKLTAVDGFNGIYRGVQQFLKPSADKEFLQKTLTPAERKHIVPASKFHFAVVSARRATIDQGIQDIMTVEAQFKACGVKPKWYVDADSLKAYQALGLDAKVGGKLTPARNLALSDATKLGKCCVQVSDDIGKWEFLDIAKQNFSGETTMDKANKALKGCPRMVMSPLAAAQFLLAKMRGSPLKPQLGGVFPTANAAMSMGTHEYTHYNFVLGDFFVVDKSKVRFDNTMTLKEDYDFTCSHIKAHGSILRCNRLFVHAKHATNKGGAVAVRDSAGTKERYNIDILMRKWPGVFTLNKKRANEVLMKWKHHKEDAADGEAPAKATKKTVSKSMVKQKLKVKSGKAAAAGVKNKLHRLAKVSSAFPRAATVHYTGSMDGADYMVSRCKAMNKRSVEECIGKKYVRADGKSKSYGLADLRYDIKAGRLVLKK
eukprot:TRINITY_DN102451_c0_g1_i1.p1 TRINITY_DN102451_c0_g1~~TRINITY_DN102451_c0_g1_i1.p1  ORF type:complete len:585 (-),score=200.17 TRINITY_DN102451_c0_g1_i1:262-2016(-)